MKHTPILFSTPMVEAILEGRKTQTRRILKMHRENNVIEGYTDNLDIPKPIDFEGFGVVMSDFRDVDELIKFPYGNIGDILWVRETYNMLGDEIAYKASPELFKQTKWYKQIEKAFKISSLEMPHPNNCIKWKPSIFMPKAACRIFLKITDIRVERLQDISCTDANKEGVIGTKMRVSKFKTLWQSINGKESWNENPWVWAITFQRTEKHENFI